MSATRNIALNYYCRAYISCSFWIQSIIIRIQIRILDPQFENTNKEYDWELLLKKSISEDIIFFDDMIEMIATRIQTAIKSEDPDPKQWFVVWKKCILFQLFSKMQMQLVFPNVSWKSQPNNLHIFFYTS